MKKNLDIQFYRAILIVGVMFYHFTYRFYEIYSIKIIYFFSLDKWGIILDDCFFIIAGLFIIENKIDDFDLKSYIKKK